MNFNPCPSNLVVLSHLRWNWVWQRPQHLISRLATHHPNTLFIEEPVVGPVSEPRLRQAAAGPVQRIWLEVPEGRQAEFGAADCADYAELLLDAYGGQLNDAVVWLYAPTALHIAEAMKPRVLTYDMMDDLSAFADGGGHLRQLQSHALRRADIVFAGGRSLHRTAASVRGVEGTHLFPSGVEIRHYFRSRAMRRTRERPVAGYVGVIDERLDLDLVADLATKLDDWDIHLVGPHTKIDPDTLPRAANIHYLGMQPYELLPEIMAGFDVALMPFALNDATRSISPTKTLEYLAAGLPVVSTRVPDVVAGWHSVVRLADDAGQFAQACREVRMDSREERDRRMSPLRLQHEWDTIADRMAVHLQETYQRRAATSEVAA